MEPWLIQQSSSNYVYSSSLWSTTSCSLGNFNSISIMPGMLLKTTESNSSKPYFWRKGSWKGTWHFLVWCWHWAEASSESPLETGNTPVMHQATWQWLVNSKCTISKDDRQDLMSIMLDLVSAKTPRIWRNQGPSCIRQYFTEIFSVSRIFEQSYREKEGMSTLLQNRSQNKK